MCVVTLSHSTEGNFLSLYIPEAGGVGAVLSPSGGSTGKCVHFTGVCIFSCKNKQTNKKPWSMLRVLKPS